MRLIDADKAIGRYYAEWEKQDISDGAQDRDWLKQCIDEAPHHRRRACGQVPGVQAL